MISMDTRPASQGPPAPDAASARRMLPQDDAAPGGAGARPGFAGVLSRQATGAADAAEPAASSGDAPPAPDPSGAATPDAPTQAAETTPARGDGTPRPAGDGRDDPPLAAPVRSNPDARASHSVAHGDGGPRAAGGDAPHPMGGSLPGQGGQPGHDGPAPTLGSADPAPAPAARAALPPRAEVAAPPRPGPRAAPAGERAGWTTAVPSSGPGARIVQAAGAAGAAGPLAPALPPLGGPRAEPGRLPGGEGAPPGGDLAPGPAGDRPAAGVPPAPATAPGPRATPAHVAQQLAVGVSVARGGETEVRLNPEELGRVRLSLSGAEGTLTVSISAERPETADLLRRHIDSLAREFAALGYGDVGFQFEGESREDRARDHPGGQGDSASDPAPTEESAPQPPRRILVLGGGLDLKL